MSHRATLIYGDGIGPEVVKAAVQVVKACGVEVQWDERLLGLAALNALDTAVPEETVASIMQNRVALKGPTTTPVGFGHRSANVELRRRLDLFACIRPVRSLPKRNTRFGEVDLVVVRENTEGLYSGQEVEIHSGCTASLRIMTEEGCRRIVTAAFEFARANGRREVVVAHKANILKLGDGLLLKIARSVREKFSDIAYRECIIDALCMSLVQRPSDFDVLVMENMFGDIVSDLCAGMVGGLGVVPGANFGHDIAVFEAVHGSAPDIAGKGIANPTAMIKCAAMMLSHIGEDKSACKILGALDGVLSEPKLCTRDLGGEASTDEFTKNLIQRL